MMLRLLLILTILLSANISYADSFTTSHGLSIFGDLKYPNNFKHFDYVNPDAPKGGDITLAEIGSYDSLNPFILKGVPEGNINLTFDTLMTSSADETASAYGLIAESAELDNERKWIIFNINPKARWHDGSQVTANDVKFSFDTIKSKGHPYYKIYYHDIASAEILSKEKVKFIFSSTTNRELPLIISQLPVISEKYYKSHDFEKTTLEAPMGSGPYIVKSLEPGRSITYERVKNYWANNLPVNKGRYNFNTIRYDYYRDELVSVEALKAGQYDFRKENISKSWNTLYNIPQVHDGRMIKEELRDGVPSGMQSYVFNIRRQNFKNPKVREAISYAFDFEWANKQLFFSAYARNKSFFGSSEFASSGIPSPAELKLLNPFKNILPERVFTEEYSPPITDASGNNRSNLIKAKQLLEEAGWFLRDMKLINPETNKPVEIEFLLSSPAMERPTAPFIKSLKKLGIEATIHTVDSSQYINRMEDFDFDITTNWFTQSASPGNEQFNYWSSEEADRKGSKNYVGIKNPAVDEMIRKITSATTKDDLITATRSLDRILLWNFYVIPQWHSRTHRIIYWNKFGRPKNNPPYALGFVDTWWIDQKKITNLK